MHFEENVPLAPFTTLRIGGPARYFVRISSEPELLEAVAYARSNQLAMSILGGGSNLVVPDAGYAGLVIHIAIPQSIELIETEGAILVNVSAGTDWNALVLELCERQINGMECLAGIPGLVGGAPIQNIGAYGQEVAQSIESVRALDRESLSFVDLPRQACGFAYRTSIFNSTHRDRYILTSVRFRLDPESKPNLSYADLAWLRAKDPSPLAVYEAVRAIRRTKGMLIDEGQPMPDTRSAGSFFKNPVVPGEVLSHIAEALEISPDAIPHWPGAAGRIKLPAAWLIERAGFCKGFTLTANSGVGISSRHTLALINRSGAATCAELLALRDHIASEISRRFQITLEQEPVYLQP